MRRTRSIGAYHTSACSSWYSVSFYVKGGNVEFLFGSFTIIWFIVGIVLFVGWIKNIFKIVKTKPFEWSGSMIMRIVGIFIPIIGGIMGFVKI